MSVAVLAILAIVWLSLAQHSGILLYTLLPVPLMIVSARVYKKRGSELQRSLRSHAHYKQGIARLEGRWTGLGIRGEEFMRADHVYDKDLDLFERNKEWFYAISRALLVGTQVFWGIEEWRSKYSEALVLWLSAWGQFEALAALACYAYEHPENAFPKFLEGESAFEAKGIGHPLLPVDTCVRNNLSLNGSTRLYIISGSNMAGKSTLIRAIGLNAILAYSGAPVCAEGMSLSLFSVCAAISIHDSLLNGRSKFLTEMDRLKYALNLTKGKKPVLFLIDEPLSGTNSRDRRIAAEAIVKALIQGGALGIISTHDLALTELAAIPDLRGINVHMGSKDGSDPMNFDFKVKPGVTEESNALSIARLAGVAV